MVNKGTLEYALMLENVLHLPKSWKKADKKIFPAGRFLSSLLQGMFSDKKLAGKWK